MTKKSETKTLSEPESRALLRQYEIPCVSDSLVEGPDAAVAAAREFGYPVVLKLSGAGLAHKSERGLVRLGIGDEESVSRACTDLLAAARPEDHANGVLVSPMVEGSREFIAGCYRDSSFGACVMFGLGGVLTEALADISFRLAPLDYYDAMGMMSELTAARLLDETRGEPAVDRKMLAYILEQLGVLICEREEVVSVDINPIRIVDGKPLALDALVEVRP